MFFWQSLCVAAHFLRRHRFGRAMPGFRPSPFRSLYKYGSWAPKDSLAPLLSLLHLFPPIHPFYLWLQYIFLPHDASFKPQNLWTWNAGQSLVLYLNCTTRSLFDITSTRERNSSRFSIVVRYAPYGSNWYLNSMEQRCSCNKRWFKVRPFFTAQWIWLLRLLVSCVAHNLQGVDM